MISKFALLSVFTLVAASGFADDGDLTPKEVKLSSPKVRMKSPTVKAAFAPFTGKVNGDNVRVRLQPDLEGFIVEEVGKNEYISVVDQDGEYYSIAPPETIKAYIFRSFVLDGIVEGNRVNVRLEPDLEAPVIGHLNSGDAVDGIISKKNKKWLEIAPPSTTRFYVAKEFIDNAGGPELKAQMAQRKETVAELIVAAGSHSEEELQKPFEEVDIDQVKHNFQTIINEYSDFPSQVLSAKEGLAKAQEAYLQKRIDYLEHKASLVASVPSSDGHKHPSAGIPALVRMWEPVEEALFLTWSEQHGGRSKEEFYDEQKALAVTLSGVLESYSSPVRNKPGDFVVKDKGRPVAFVYSTKVNLNDYEGKKVTVVGAERSNNNFAFPAYYVLDVE